MKNKNIVAISLAVIVLLFIGGILAFQNTQSTSVEKYTSFDKEPFVRPHSTTFGENKKNVIVVEFLDPQCEACAVFHGAVKAVYKEYYEDIQLVIRYLPNHKNSMFTVKLLEAAKKQNKYNEVLETIFNTQNQWAQHNNEKPGLLWNFIARVDGIDMEKLKNDVESMDLSDQVKLDRQDARTLGVRGTPTFFVNGEKLQSLSPQALMDLVENKLFNQ